MNLTDDKNLEDTVASLVAATKTFGEGDAAVTAVDDVTIGFRRGQFTAVMGPSGSRQVNVDVLPVRP